MPVSYAQERLWFLQQLAPADPAYNEPLCLRIGGPVDVPALDRALSRLAARHEMLRSTFVPGRAGVGYLAHPAGAIAPVRTADFTSVPARDRDAVAAAECARQATVPFDLAALPLLRASLLRFGDDDHALVIATHHILMDGWSEETLLSELGALYAGDDLGEVPGRLSDITAAERSAPPDAEAAAFWLQHTGTAPLDGVVPLAGDPVPPQSAALTRTQLPLADPELVFQLARTLATSPFCVLRTAYELAFAQLTGHVDFLLGCPFGNRPASMPEEMLGFFINLLPIRSSIRGAADFREAVRNVSLTVAESMSYGAYPYAHIVRALRGNAGSADPKAGSPVQQAFAYDVARPVTSFGGIPARRLPMPPPRPRFDLVMTVTQVGGSLNVAVDAADGRLDPSFAGELLTAFGAQLMNGMAQCKVTA